MITITSAKFRQNLKAILEKVGLGEIVILKYYNQEFILKTKTKNSSITKSGKTKTSQSVAKILANLNDPETDRLIAEIKQKHPELYNMSIQDEKTFIRNEMASKYGL